MSLLPLAQENCHKNTVIAIEMYELRASCSLLRCRLIKMVISTLQKFSLDRSIVVLSMGSGAYQCRSQNESGPILARLEEFIIFICSFNSFFTYLHSFV